MSKSYTSRLTVAVAAVAAVACCIVVLLVSSERDSGAAPFRRRILTERSSFETSTFWQSGHQLAVKGNDGSPSSAFPLELCEGDCDSDDDCQGSYICWERDFGDIVPGCNGDITYNNWDYCIDPSHVTSSTPKPSSAPSPTKTTNKPTVFTPATSNPSTPKPSGAPTRRITASPTASPTSSVSQTPITKTIANVANNGSPSSAFPLGMCEGDCDDDSDCFGGLVCFSRSGTEFVPGCSGSSQYPGVDFCIDPSYTIDQTALPSLNYVGSNVSPGSLGECQGSCTSNGDCQSGLFCYLRSAYESVPGCQGMDSSDANYCIDPHELHSIPPQNTDNNGDNGKTFALKIFWQKGYMWQGEPFERKWCFRCESDSATCSAGQRIYLTNCDTDSLRTEFEVQYASGSNAFQFKVSNSDLCLAFPSTDHVPLIVDYCNSNNELQFFYAQNGNAAWGSHFEINPVWAKDGCIGDTHHPKYDESIYVWPCTESRYWTTNFYQFY